MKVHWSLWVALAILIVIIVFLSARREGYAPPRDENTQPPYTEDVGNIVTTSNNLPYVDSTSNVARVDNQTDVYEDMAGLDFQLQAGNPILNFIQGDPSSNVMYGDFVPNESDGGSARMYAYEDREMIAEGDTMTNTSNLLAVPGNPTMMKTVYGIDVNGNIINPTGTQIEVNTDQERNFLLPSGVDIKGSPIMPDSGQYIPTLTSPMTPFLGDQPGISASKSPASETSPAAAR
jgi:hypothetical protein